MPKRSFDDVYAFERTTLGTLAPTGATLPRVVASKPIKSGLWVRHVWAVIAPYFWLTPPQNWNHDFDVVFRFQDVETGRLTYRASNEFFSSTHPVGFIINQGGEQPTMTFKPKQAVTAGYENIDIAPISVAVEADNAELVLNRVGTTAPYDVNSFLSGFRILSQRPV